MAPTWTLPAGATDKALILEHIRRSLPRAFFAKPRAEEIVHATAEVYAAVLAQGRDWVRMTYILFADKAWLREHGLDRGLRIQAGESDEQFRERTRNPEDLVTRPALLAIADKLLAIANVSGQANAIELPCDGAFMLDVGATTTEATEYAFLTDGEAATPSFGYRLNGQLCSSFIVVLPAGTPAATAAAIEDALRVSKAHGIIHQVETANVA